MVARIRERLEARLPWDVYVLQGGLVLNALGNGIANPFVLLYLHDVRHIPLAQAGLASAANAAAALCASLVGGSVADRLGPKATVIGGLALASATFLAYPVVVTTGWEAILFTVCALSRWCSRRRVGLAIGPCSPIESCCVCSRSMWPSWRPPSRC